MSDAISKRTCDGCTLCCFTHGVMWRSRVVTEQFSDCKHCVKGFGCEIYTNHPAACKEFTCLWRLGETPEVERPDKIGIVLERKHTLEHEIVKMIVTNDARGTPIEREITLRYARRRIPVGRVYEDKSQLVYPVGAVLTEKQIAAAKAERIEIVFIETGDPP